MTRWTPLQVVALAACAASPDHAPAPPPVARAAAAERPTAAVPDPWPLAADSAIRRHLERQLFLGEGGHAPGFTDCSGDEGSDNPTLRAAVVRARPIGHTAVRVDSSEEYPNVVKATEFQVEVTSVAIMVPAWIGKFDVDSAPRNRDLYEARIAPRVDTFAIALQEFTTRRAGTPRWAVCDPSGPAVSNGDGPGFWNFANARDEPNETMGIGKWTPVDGSWARVVALADSVRATGIRN